RRLVACALDMQIHRNASRANLDSARDKEFPGRSWIISSNTGTGLSAGPRSDISNSILRRGLLCGVVLEGAQGPRTLPGMDRICNFALLAEPFESRKLKCNSGGNRRAN